MQVGYEQWREGTGYDLDAFAQIAGPQRDEIARQMRDTATPDWRDLEVLGATRVARVDRAVAAHHRRARSANADSRQRLCVLIDGGYAAGSVPDVQLAHLIDEIEDADDLLPALDLASWHGGPITKLALLRGAHDRPSVSLHFAARLLDAANLSDDMAAFDPKFRPTLLRLRPDNNEQDRAVAFGRSASG